MRREWSGRSVLANGKCPKQFPLMTSRASHSKHTDFTLQWGFYHFNLFPQDLKIKIFRKLPNIVFWNIVKEMVSFVKKEWPHPRLRSVIRKCSVIRKWTWDGCRLYTVYSKGSKLLRSQTMHVNESNKHENLNLNYLRRRVGWAVPVKCGVLVIKVTKHP